MYHVILAGGLGSRFWPKSRKNKPKQLLKILGNQSMIRMTFNRLKKISSKDSILIIASKNLIQELKKEIPELPEINFIIEPSGKNTAPAIGLAAIHVFSRDQNAVMGIYPSDHLIINENKFKNTIERVHEFAIKKSSLITLGIKPTYPATGYGYIQFEKNKEIKKGIFKVKTFAEKPPINSAKLFVNSGEFLWNSGMFIWKAETFLKELKNYMPELHQSLQSIYESINSLDYKMVLKNEWKLIQSISIDYGLMEKTKNVYTIFSDFGWNDMGSWNSIYDVFPKDENGMVLDGKVFSKNSSNSVVLSNNKFTAVIGADDLIIINTDDATLVIKKDQAEEVKDIVTYLKNNDMEEYL